MMSNQTNKVVSDYIGLYLAYKSRAAAFSKNIPYRRAGSMDEASALGKDRLPSRGSERLIADVCDYDMAIDKAFMPITRAAKDMRLEHTLAMELLNCISHPRHMINSSMALSMNRLRFASLANELKENITHHLFGDLVKEDERLGKKFKF